MLGEILASTEGAGAGVMQLDVLVQRLLARIRIERGGVAVFDDAAEENVDLCLSAGLRYARLQARECMQPHHFLNVLAQVFMQPVAARHDEWLHHHRHPEIRFVADAFTGKTRRSHSDHGERSAQHLNGSTQHGNISAKPFLPIIVTDDGVRILSGTLALITRKEASNRRIDAENGKIFFRHQTPVRVFRLASGNPHLPTAHLRLRGAQAFQRGCMIAQLRELGIGQHAPFSGVEAR